jgi:hypothetical protein
MPRKHGRSSSRSTTASMNGVRKRTRDDSTLEDEVGSTREPSPLKAARTTCFQSPTSQRQRSAGPTIRKASPPTPARLPPLQSIIAELDGDDDEDEVEFVGEKICIRRCFDPNDGISVASGKAWADGRSRRKRQSTQHLDTGDQHVRSGGRAPTASASTRGPVVSTKSRSNRTANTDNGKNRGMTVDDAIEIMSTSSESSEVSDVPSLPSIASLGAVPKVSQALRSASSVDAHLLWFYSAAHPSDAPGCKQFSYKVVGNEDAGITGYQQGLATVTLSPCPLRSSSFRDIVSGSRVW